MVRIILFGIFFNFIILCLYSEPQGSACDLRVKAMGIFLYGSVLYESKQYDQAAAYLKQSSELLPEEDFIRFKLAQAYIHLRENEEAFKVLDPLSRANTLYAGEADILLASICLAEKKEEDALFYLKHALDIDQKNKNTYYVLSQLYEEMGLTQEAINTNEKAVEMFPYETPFHAKLAQLYLIDKQYSRALPHFKIALVDQESNVKFLMGAALCCLKLELLEDAVKYLESALTKDPLNPSIYAELISLKIRQKEYQEAFLICEQWISVNPQEITGYLNYGWLALQIGEYEKGVQFLQKNEEFFSNDGNYAYCLARLFIGRQNDQIAEEYFKKALSLSTEKKYEICYQYALLLHRQKRHEEALKILEEGLKDNPNHALSCNFIGYLLLTMNRPANEALIYIEKAVSMEPENPAFLDSMGWALYKKGNFQEARLYLEQAARFSDSKEIQQHLFAVKEALSKKASSSK